LKNKTQEAIKTFLFRRKKIFKYEKYLVVIQASSFFLLVVLLIISNNRLCLIGDSFIQTINICPYSYYLGYQNDNNNIHNLMANLAIDYRIVFINILILLLSDKNY